MIHALKVANNWKIGKQLLNYVKDIQNIQLSFTCKLKECTFYVFSLEKFKYIIQID